MIPRAFLPLESMHTRVFLHPVILLNVKREVFKKRSFPLQAVELQMGVNVNLLASKVVECDKCFVSPPI